MSRQHADRDLAWPAAGETGTLASDGDRDAAARVLNEAFAEGRLTADEHGERVRAAYAARTWSELARLTADLPDQGDAAGRAAGMPDGLHRCLLCALLIVCPPAGIAWLLASWHRSRAGRRHVLAAPGGPSVGLADAAARAGDGRRAEDR
jgi:hypothetical protein